MNISEPSVQYVWEFPNLTFSDLNYTNTTDPARDAWEHWSSLMQDRAVVVSLLLLFSLATVFGNMLVILAVVRERYLHTPTNYFITSLAVADCLVGLVVMPFSALYEVLEHTWFFGTDWCDIWRSLDVLFSTASILNLCVISLDRYWAITDPITYPMRMTRVRSVLLIAGVWVCSSAISFPAIVWWRAVRTDPVPAFKCPFTEHLGYLIFSSTISFYLPLFVMVFTYYRIYRAAAAQTKSLRLGTKQILLGSGELELTLRIHRGGTCKIPETRQYSGQEDEPLTALANNGLTRLASNRGVNSKNFSLSRKLAKFAKEKKAAKTLGIVMGVFIVCWLPFFVVNLLSGFCSDCIWQEETVLAVVTWLGWVNSSMNPVIYACWSRDFRRFQKILLLCCLVRDFVDANFLKRWIGYRGFICWLASSLERSREKSNGLRDPLDLFLWSLKLSVYVRRPTWLQKLRQRIIDECELIPGVSEMVTQQIVNRLAYCQKVHGEDFQHFK